MLNIPHSPIPRAEASTLLAFVLGIEPKELLTAVPPSPDQERRYQSLLVRRAAGEPLQYLTGKAYFRTVAVEVGPGVFIPRPETEVMTGWAVEWLGSSPGTVVELCVGSGAVSLAVATELPGLRQYAVEIDPVAFSWAERNLAQTQVLLRLGDMATSFPELDQQADLVIANPPYVPEDELGLVGKDVLEHEPALAVFSGPDGLDAVQTVIAVAARLLRPAGALCFEHAESNAAAAAELVRASGAFTQVQTHPDLTRRPRFTTAVRGPVL
ncbi:MAG: peptide chain release factor N(5)-glutamine methyltransferase [Propionibacteriaceae bacterium]|jgi:release factor glutamine methyltransferase|nr:peptide chain release factor N(5)-glutamine methyltransferase [Propionibacteriaceae bacterium]